MRTNSKNKLGNVVSTMALFSAVPAMPAVLVALAAMISGPAVHAGDKSRLHLAQATTQTSQQSSEVIKINDTLVKLLAPLQVPGESAASITFQQLEVGDVDGQPHLLNFDAEAKIALTVQPPEEIKALSKPETYTFNARIIYAADVKTDPAGGAATLSPKLKLTAKLNGNLKLLLPDGSFDSEKQEDFRAELLKEFKDFATSLVETQSDALSLQARISTKYEGKELAATELTFMGKAIVDMLQLAPEEIQKVPAKNAKFKVSLSENSAMVSLAIHLNPNYTAFLKASHGGYEVAREVLDGETERLERLVMGAEVALGGLKGYIQYKMFAAVKASAIQPQEKEESPADEESNPVDIPDPGVAR